MTQQIHETRPPHNCEIRTVIKGLTSEKNRIVPLI